MYFSRPMMRIASGALVVASMSTIFAPLVRAEEATSSNFSTTDTVVNDFGGTSSSTNFSSVESGGEISNTEASSTNFTLNAGSLFFGSTLLARNWRWYDDETNETPSTALAAENVSPTNIADQNIIKLRITVTETSGTALGNLKFGLEFATTSDFSENVRLLADIAGCTDASEWCYADGAGIDNAVIASSTLSEADPCVLGAGNGCGTHNESATSTSTFTHPSGATAECEFTIRQSGAVASTVYFFRLYDTASSSTVPTASGASYPSVTVEGGTLTFAIEGISSGISTEGVVTDINTSPEGVLFGTLAFGSPINAAHRLTVSANAGSGYKVFTYQRQGLLDAGAAEIDPITGTNANPADWSTGCVLSASGCYGYHTGDDLLDGGSPAQTLRFLQNDTYARFSSAPEEVAFNAGPASSQSTDIVYRLQVRNNQEVGDYASTIVYIVTPVF